MKTDIGGKKKKKATDIWPTCQRKRPPPLDKTGQVEMEKGKRLKDSFTSEEEEDVL